jgi:arsenite methyltransferase
MAILGPLLPRMRYLGADISEAIDVAKARCTERELDAAFLQSDLQQLPLPDACVDLILCEGVLHHTDDTRAALTAVVRHLKPGGRIIFYVYRKKGPIREFTDDYIRHILQTRSQQEAWDALLPLSRLGQVLGDLDITIDVPENIELLEIPAGPINLQRLFYWHVFKIFYQPELTLQEMNHVNFDWYAPLNAHRHTPEELREWCKSLGLHIEHEFLEEAGISLIAKKAGSAQPTAN